jgi:NADPH:quinone reductase-like Zn-dependent oxidoreductase
MRALQFTTLGNAEDVLTLADLPTPTPAAGEVLIRVEARPINPSDIMFTRGLYGIRPQLPSGAGFEGAGKIEAVGEGIELPVGTRVSFSSAHAGTWAAYACVPARQVIPVPATMPPEVACQLFVNPFTAWAILYECKLQPGEWLLQTAGASAFGKLVIQLAKRQGIKTISTVRRAEGIAELKALGADEVIDTSTENLPKRVKEITGGQYVRRAIDAVGGPAGAEVLKCLSHDGVLYVYGLLSLQDIPLNSGLLIFKNITIKGFWLTDWLAKADKDARNAVRKQVIELLAGGELKAPVEATYDLADFKQALAHDARPGRLGKIVLVG